MQSLKMRYNQGMFNKIVISWQITTGLGFYVSATPSFYCERRRIFWNQQIQKRYQDIAGIAPLTSLHSWGSQCPLQSFLEGVTLRSDVSKNAEAQEGLKVGVVVGKGGNPSGCKIVLLTTSSVSIKAGRWWKILKPFDFHCLQLTLVTSQVCRTVCVYRYTLRCPVSNGRGAATVGPVAVTSGPAKDEHELGLFAATLKHHRHLFLHLRWRKMYQTCEMLSMKVSWVACWDDDGWVGFMVLLMIACWWTVVLDAWQKVGGSTVNLSKFDESNWFDFTVWTLVRCIQICIYIYVSSIYYTVFF